MLIPSYLTKARLVALAFLAGEALAAGDSENGQPIPPVDMNILPLGGDPILDSEFGAFPAFLSYELIPFQHTCGDRIGVFSRSPDPVDRTSLWRLEPVPNELGGSDYMLCLQRLNGCVQLGPPPCAFSGSCGLGSGPGPAHGGSDIHEYLDPSSATFAPPDLQATEADYFGTDGPQNNEFGPSSSTAGAGQSSLEDTPEGEDGSGFYHCPFCFMNLLKGLYIGKGGPMHAMKFRVRESGPGEYTFESTWFPGFFLVVDDSIDDGKPFLAQVLGSNFQDLRSRFELYASKEDLQQTLFTYAPIDGLGASAYSDSKVLQVERVELTRYQIAQTNKPCYFESLLEIDHLAEVPILTRFQPSQRGTVLLMHENTKFITAQPKVINPGAGWKPGNCQMEPTVHRWSHHDPTEWNQLLRATSDIKINGYGVITLTCSTDVSYYRSKYIQEMIFKDGESVLNLGFLWSSSIGPMVFEINEI